MDGLVEDLLREAQEIRGHTVAESSRNIYAAGLRKYEETMRGLERDPFPLEIQKMELFLVLMKRQGKCYNTLAGYVRSFSFYFRSNNLDVLTQSMDFKIFMSGLRRDTTREGESPKAKEPFRKEWFEQISRCIPMGDIDNRRMMFWMTLCFHAFLRISELMCLRKRDIRINIDEGRMELYIRRSKTDQFGAGESTFVFKTGEPSSPWSYLDILDDIGDDDLIVGQTKERTLRSRLKRLLQVIGVKETGKYSFHSFRRGGAHLASAMGVNDCVIKAHGRWRSEAYLRYVSVDKRMAGRTVADALMAGGGGAP